MSCALAEIDKKVLMIDLDPQGNLTICGMDEEKLHNIWEEEDSFIDVMGFDETKKKIGQEKFKIINTNPRSIHYLLSPTFAIRTPKRLFSDMYRQETLDFKGMILRNGL
ncbi:MAG: AAA family ATPase [Candidatus Brocadiaceae bacterium]